MATAVRISAELVDEAKRFSRIDHRSLAGQIEHWRVWENVQRKIRICHIPSLKKSYWDWMSWIKAIKRNTGLDRFS
jgi:hypothetical protein